MLASVLVLIVTMTVYFKSNLLQTAAGKSELMVLIGIFWIHFGYIWVHNVNGKAEMILLAVILSGGLLMTYFWTSVLTFDVWRSFR